MDSIIYTVYRHYEGGPAHIKRGRLSATGLAAGYIREGEHDAYDGAKAAAAAINATVPPPKPLNYFPTRTLAGIERGSNPPSTGTGDRT